MVIEILFLPVAGVEKKDRRGNVALPHNYRLASNEALPKPKKKRQDRTKASIGDMQLLATYQDPVRSLAVINKKAKSSVVGVGDDVFGYHVEEIGEKAVLLRKDGKEYRLEIKENNKNSFSTRKRGKEERGSRPVGTIAKIRKDGDMTLVPRHLINQYTKNMDKILKEISVVPQKKGGQLVGFRIRYIKRNSVFDKLGLKRGDVITAINGEAIEDYGAAMEIFQSADSLDELTLTIKRGKKEMELNYEVE